MSISYKKLWKLLIDRDMKKKELAALAGISQSSITKLGKVTRIIRTCHKAYNTQQGLENGA